MVFRVKMKRWKIKMIWNCQAEREDFHVGDVKKKR